MAKLATKLNKVLLSRADLKALGIWQSNSTLIRLEQAGRFPVRIRLSGACVCWDRDELLSWIDARKSERATWHYEDAR
ncbi:hypothetical protein ROLI_030250 [Roseobacter fucihabitans]|uniref:Transcriptional regulator n=1 Tax=Roseobacter fucihabitans TaxID=1537242 RepID=A0ABZ2BXN4_9RHOB|nr:AlpA family phage regulatory protein [Roseobacter litoralis]MBC6967899.1 Prophage CP4-57 regulatory protein (AlpA) [Roseobacter litoralis]MBC6968075.1 Prophage CP4-57 regulatory protein (AlpA) [Roseobacter litoralis]